MDTARLPLALFWIALAGCEQQQNAPEIEPDASTDASTDASADGALPDATADECSTADDCPLGERCVAGQCQGEMPCDCPAVEAPVCGVDGMTYANACEAACAGIEVADDGACAECTCSDGIDAVCGIDGMTYDNACRADCAGVAIASEGACPEQPTACGARVGDTCAADEYCDFESELCDFADATGQCRPRPDDCPAVIDPVCGCDGMTHDSECLAQAAGVDVSTRGPCAEPEPPACDEAACGPAPGLPVVECADGSTAGPTGRCLRGEDGICAWEITVCPPAPGDACEDNGDCAVNDFCRPPEGRCLADGVCTPRPEGCFLVLDPVCGCDDVTYDNACEAEAAGVGVAFAGECPALGLCLDSEDCPADAYCARGPGQCGLPGECLPRPVEVCPDLPGRVCGCDGVTYDSACAAATAGVSVDEVVACPGDVVACTGNADCGADEFCERAVGACDGEGVCTRRPEACDLVFDPVCGCDGMTYSNDCTAASAGLSVAQVGECMTGR